MKRLRPTLLLIIILVGFLTASTIFEGAAATLNDENSTTDTQKEIVTYFPTIALMPAYTNCRYGVNNLPGRPGNQWITAIGVGHYINFTAGPLGSPVPDSVDLLRQVRVQQERNGDEYLPGIVYTPPLTMLEDGLGPIVLANPGQLWIVGNEPEVANITQDNIMPAKYAEAYHEVYHFIKGLDPTAHFANGGLSMMTPGRRQYLEIVWNTYLQKYGEQMPVDVWNMHLYILSEIRQSDGGHSDGKIALGTDPTLAIKDPSGPPATECPKEDVYCRAEHDDITIFENQVIMMRQWMKNHGQQNKPLILSEFSQLYPFVDYDDVVNPTRCFLMDEYGQCFTPNRVIEFMGNTFEYLEEAKDPNLGYAADDYRLVQQYAWYSMWTNPETTGASSNLLLDDHDDYLPEEASVLSQVGTYYRDRVLSKKQTVDLVAGIAKNVTVKAEQPSGTADVKLEAGFLNNGTGIIVDRFKVTFYKDSALSNPIGTITIEPGYTGIINGCAWDRITEWTSLTWSDLPVGTHNYWVKIDSRNNIRGESNEGNNVVKGKVTVTP